jgi:hypothetical protein
LNELLAAAVIGLAGWRTAYSLVLEDGPWGSLTRLRRRFGVPEQGEVHGLLPLLFSCTNCSLALALTLHRDR